MYLKLQKICQRAVGTPRNMPKISNVPVTASLQHHTTFLQRPCRIHDALTARKKLQQRAHDPHTARIQCSPDAHSGLFEAIYHSTCIYNVTLLTVVQSHACLVLSTHIYMLFISNSYFTMCFS